MLINKFNHIRFQTRAKVAAYCAPKGNKQDRDKIEKIVTSQLSLDEKITGVQALLIKKLEDNKYLTRFFPDENIVPFILEQQLNRFEQELKKDEVNPSAAFHICSYALPLASLIITSYEQSPVRAKKDEYLNLLLELPKIIEAYSGVAKALQNSHTKSLERIEEEKQQGRFVEGSFLEQEWGFNPVAYTSRLEEGNNPFKLDTGEWVDPPPSSSEDEEDYLVG